MDGGRKAPGRILDPGGGSWYRWQGLFLLFGDKKGGVHLMRGSEVLIRDIGISCGNGGFWPYDRMAEVRIFGLFGSEPGTVPGALVGGINGLFPWVRTNVLYYRDDGNCNNNEAGISLAPVYLFAVHAMKKAGF